MAMDLHLTQYTISASTVYIINAIQLKHITCHIYSIPAFFCHQLGKSTIKIPVLPAPLSYHLPLLTFSKAVSDKPKYVTLSASVSGTHTRCFIKKDPFLRATAECFACLCHRLGVSPSVRLSHS